MPFWISAVAAGGGDMIDKNSEPLYLLDSGVMVRHVGVRQRSGSLLLRYVMLEAMRAMTGAPDHG